MLQQQQQQQPVDQSGGTSDSPDIAVTVPSPRSASVDGSAIQGDNSDSDSEDPQPQPQPGPKRPSTRLLDLCAGWMEAAEDRSLYTQEQFTALFNLYQQSAEINFDGALDAAADGQLSAAFIEQRVVPLIESRDNLTHLLAGWHTFILDETDHSPWIGDTVRPSHVHQLRCDWAAGPDVSIHDFVQARVIPLLLS